tara:strand:+ start:513 stop:1124 length:612 start_codon:yes stop_codon:yes gene_type:complete
MPAADTIIFDLGGVLIDWNPEYLYRKIFSEEDDLRYFLENICTSDWNEEQDAGYPLAQATAELAIKYPQYDGEIKAYYGRWQEMLGGYEEECVAILEYLHQQQNCRLLALTNWSGETFHTAKNMYPFLGLFEGIVISGDEKIKKPDPRLYQVLIDRYGIQPVKSIFIDDTNINVEAAADLGFQTIHFLSANQLQDELQKLGLM